MMSASPLRNFREFRLLELSEKSRGSLQQNLMGHQNGTFRPILTSVYGQIHGQSVARTTFRTVSLGSSVNRDNPLSELETRKPLTRLPRTSNLPPVLPVE